MAFKVLSFVNRSWVDFCQWPFTRPFYSVEDVCGVRVLKSRKWPQKVPTPVLKLSALDNGDLERFKWFPDWWGRQQTLKAGSMLYSPCNLPMNLTYWLFLGTYGQVLVNGWKRNFHLSHQSYKSLYPQRVYGVFHLEILYWGLPWWSCGWDSAPNVGGTGSIPGRGTKVL